MVVVFFPAVSPTNVRILRPKKEVSTLPPQSEASSMSGINRSSECSPIIVSDGQANSTLLSFPRKTGLSECVLALEIILEAPGTPLSVQCRYFLYEEGKDS